MKMRLFAVVMSVFALFACTVNAQDDKKAPAKGEVIKMDKKLFIEKIFDFEKEKEFKFKGDKPIVIDFYADWCGPCRMVAPILKDLAKEYANDIVIYKVNVDNEKELAAMFNVRNIPTFVFMSKDGEVSFMKGAAEKSAYKRQIDTFLLNKKQ